MKKVVLNYLVIAALAVAAALVSSCTDDKTDVNTFTVTFNSNGGSAVTDQSVTKGEKAEEPEPPAKSGYTFDGWYADNETFAQKWKFNTDVVTENITLYAKWTLNGNNEGDGNQLTVTVENGAKYDNVIDRVKLMMYDHEGKRVVALATGKWSNGGFTIELPKTVDAKYLVPAVEQYNYLSNLTVSNINAKIGHASFIGYDKDDNIVAAIYYGKWDFNFSIGAYYYYADCDVDIFGKDEEVLMKQDYSLNYKKGWNKYYQISPMVVGEWVRSTTNVVNGLKWWCDNIELSDTPEKGDVYVAGKTGGDAMLWKNGVGLFIFSGVANSVFVSGNDIYVAGYSTIYGTPNKYVAVLWKNGVCQELFEGGATSVFVSGRDVYVAGGSNSKPVLWVNGEVQTLGSNDGSANSVFVSGSDVYVAVYDGFPSLWVNGNGYNLINGYRANSVCVSGDDVYVVGSEIGWDRNTYWSVWKNLEQTKSLGNLFGVAYSVFVHGDDVYIAGSYSPLGYSQAVYLKTGKEVFLENTVDYSIARSIYVAGNDVYVAGEYNKKNDKSVKAVLWKNGVKQILSESEYDVAANSVFVIE